MPTDLRIIVPGVCTLFDFKRENRPPPSYAVLQQILYKLIQTKKAHTNILRCDPTEQLPLLKKVLRFARGFGPKRSVAYVCGEIIAFLLINGALIKTNDSERLWVIDLEQFNALIYAIKRRRAPAAITDPHDRLLQLLGEKPFVSIKTESREEDKSEEEPVEDESQEGTNPSDEIATTPEPKETTVDFSLAPHVVDRALDLFNGRVETYPEMIRLSDLLGSLVSQTQKGDKAEIDRIVFDFVLLMSGLISRIETEALDVAVDIVKPPPVIQPEPERIVVTPFGTAPELMDLFHKFLGQGTELLDFMKIALQPAPVAPPPPEVVKPVFTGCNRDAEMERLKALFEPLNRDFQTLRDIQREVESDILYIEDDPITSDFKARLKFCQSADRPKLLAAIKRAEEKKAELEAYIRQITLLIQPIQARLELVSRRLNAVKMCHQPLPTTELPELVIPEQPDINIEDLVDWEAIKVETPPDPSSKPADPASNEVDTLPEDHPETGEEQQPQKKKTKKKAKIVEEVPVIDPSTLTREEKLVLAAFAVAGQRTMLSMANVLWHQGFLSKDATSRAIVFTICLKFGDKRTQIRYLKYCGSLFEKYPVYCLVPGLKIDWIDEFFPDEKATAFRVAFTKPTKD